MEAGFIIGKLGSWYKDILLIGILVQFKQSAVLMSLFMVEKLAPWKTEKP